MTSKPENQDRKNATLVQRPPGRRSINEFLAVAAFFTAAGIAVTAVLINGIERIVRKSQIPIDSGYWWPVLVFLGFSTLSLLTPRLANAVVTVGKLWKMKLKMQADDRAWGTEHLPPTGKPPQNEEFSKSPKSRDREK